MRKWKQGKLFNPKPLPKLPLSLQPWYTIVPDIDSFPLKLGDWVKIKNTEFVHPLMMVVDIDYDHNLVTCSWHQGRDEKTFMASALRKFELFD